MRILVTGHMGFVGQHVMAALSDHDTVGVDRKAGVSWPHNLDAWRPHTLAGETSKAVIHLAAHADVKDNWTGADQLAAIERDNVTATLRLLEAARQCKTVKRFVFVSTGAVYAGCSPKHRVYSSTPPVPTSPYAASKLMGEAYVRAYAARCGWSVVIFRPGALYGPGYKHGHVADFVRQAYANKGITALNNGDARPVADVRDFAEACAEAATGTTWPNGSICNFATAEWSWRGTAALMGVPVFSEGSEARGWVGDSEGAKWHLIDGKRPVGEAVRQSILSCGWPLNPHVAIK